MSKSPHQTIKQKYLNNRQTSKMNYFILSLFYMTPDVNKQNHWRRKPSF